MISHSFCLLLFVTKLSNLFFIIIFFNFFFHQDQHFSYYPQPNYSHKPKINVIMIYSNQNNCNIIENHWSLCYVITMIFVLRKRLINIKNLINIFRFAPYFPYFFMCLCFYQYEVTLSHIKNVVNMNTFTRSLIYLAVIWIKIFDIDHVIKKMVPTVFYIELFSYTIHLYINKMICMELHLFQFSYIN